MDELKDLLKNVSDSYCDFVIGICRYVKNVDNGVQLMIDFIKEHPKAKSDDIIDAAEEFGMLLEQYMTLIISKDHLLNL